jgi:predicted kinase
MHLVDIFEGIHDKHKNKAIFMAGGPGSGKSTLVKKLLSYRGFKSIDTDRILELYAKKYNLDLKNVSNWTPEYKQQAKKIMSNATKTYTSGQLPLVFDGTGANPEKIKNNINILKNLGYDIAMIFIDINPEIAKTRNISRQRTVDMNIATTLWKKAKNALPIYKNMFGNNLIIYDGKNISEVEKQINKYLSSPIITESFSSSKIYLHGGPKNLEGGHFKRGGRRGHDMGALFFIEESDVGYKYALGYAITRGSDTGIYRVKINLPDEKIFDFTKPDHKQIAQKNLSPEEYKSWEVSKGKSGHLDWTQIDEEIITEWGFDGALFHERSKGVHNFSDHVISVGIFDPKYVEIIDFIPKKEAIEKYGKS